jgi:hypothetical protein
MRVLASLLVLAAVFPAAAVGGSFVRPPLEDLDAHTIRSASWTKEREVDFDPVAIASVTVSTGFAGWSSWDLTDMVSAWATGVVGNRGVLLKLAEEEGDFGVSGPYFPSGLFGIAALRPSLVVAYAIPTTGQSA